MNQITITPLSGMIQGYASVFNIVDSGGDIVEKGAFQDTLNGTDYGIAMLYQHNPERPIGVWEEIKEDLYGLKVKGRLTMDNSEVKDIDALIRSHAITGLSIGYRPVSVKRDRTGVRHLTKVKLIEISIVTFPMNQQARIDSPKKNHTYPNLKGMFCRKFAQTLEQGQKLL